MRQHTVPVAALLILVVLPTAPAPAETARDILERAKSLEDGKRRWEDRTQRLTLRATVANGEQRLRQLHVFTKRLPDDEEKTLSFLLAPAEVKGTGFLQWSHRGRDDEQWLYLPEFRRTRQIAARIKDEGFVGTDFTYRDLEIMGKVLRWSEAEAPSLLTGEEVVAGHNCYTIELQPKQDGTPYKKVVLALDRERLIARKLTFFDNNGTQAKLLTTDDWRDIGAIPTPYLAEMRNLTKGSHTTATLEELQFNSNLADDLFTQRYLERGMP